MKGKEKTSNLAREFTLNEGMQPPNAVDFEKLLIGYLLIDSTAVERLVLLFGSQFDIFYDHRYSKIYECVYGMHTRKLPIDFMTVIQELKRTEKLAAVGGDIFIIDLTMGVSSSAHLEYHARVVMEKYFARTIQNNCIVTYNELFKDSTDVFEKIEGLRGTVQELDELVSSSQENITMQKAQSMLIENYKKNEPPAVPVKFKGLQKNLEGFNEGDLVILGARPSIGKTAVALDFAIKCAALQIPAAVFCLEMSAIQMHKRAAANFLDISFYRLNRKILNDEEMQKMFGSDAGDLEKLPLEYDETKNLFKMLARIRILAKRGFKFIVVDYLQIITTEGMKFGSREQEIAFISRSLKAIALELKIVVLALAQVGREVEKRASKRPTIADLRESGSIEADADIVCLLHRPEFYGIKVWDTEWDGVAEQSTEGEIELQFAKYRNGSPFDARLKFWGDRMRIADLDEVREFYINPARKYSGIDAVSNENRDDEFDIF